MNKSKILYIDDETINLELFTYHFSNKYKIITASSGAEGLKLLDQEGDINVVVSDMKMPGMTGLEFIEKAKSSHPKISFFILTGYDITTEIREALEHHLILNYFRKPFDIREIQEAIDANL